MIVASLEITFVGCTAEMNDEGVDDWFIAVAADTQCQMYENSYSVHAS
eukprot:UN12659